MFAFEAELADAYLDVGSFFSRPLATKSIDLTQNSFPLGFGDKLVREASKDQEVLC